MSYAVNRKSHTFWSPANGLLKAHSSVHPFLLNNILRHETSNNPDCPTLTISRNCGCIWCSWRGLMSSPMAYPCSLLLGRPGDDVRIYVGLRNQDVDVVGVGMMHGKSVPLHLEDTTWLTLLGEEK